MQDFPRAGYQASRLWGACWAEPPGAGRHSLCGDHLQGFGFHSRLEQSQTLECQKPPQNGSPSANGDLHWTVLSLLVGLLGFIRVCHSPHITEGRITPAASSNHRILGSLIALEVRSERTVRSFSLTLYDTSQRTPPSYPSTECNNLWFGRSVISKKASSLALKPEEIGSPPLPLAICSNSQSPSLLTVCALFVWLLLPAGLH